MPNWNKEFALDLFERVASTFLAALLGAITQTGTTPVDWSDGQAMWAVLGVPTAVSLIKGLLANMANGESGASLLPTPPGPDLPGNDGPGEAGESALYVVVGVLVVVILLVVLFRLL